MRLFLAAGLLLIAAAAGAQDDLDGSPVDAPAPAVNPIARGSLTRPLGGAGLSTGTSDTGPSANPAARSGSGGAQGAAGSAASAASSVYANPTAPSAGKPMLCKTYGALDQMPHPPGSPNGHGILDLRGPDQCVSIGVVIMRKESYGICRSGESPVSPKDPACRFYYWISDVPGGPPRSQDCVRGPANSTGGKVEFGGAYPAECILPPGAYFCNIRADGFDHPTMPAKRCGGLVSAPMMQRL